MRGPMLAEPLQGRSGQGHVAILGSLAAMDMHHHAFGINISDLQVQGFGHSQAERIDSPKVDGDSWRAAGVDDLVDLFSGDDFGQRLDVLQLHLLKRFPIAFAGSGVKEFDSRESHAEGAISELLFVLEVQKVSPQLVFVDLVGLKTYIDQ